MNKKLQIPAHLKIKANVGVLIMAGGNIVMIFLRDYFLLGFILIIIGAVLLFPAVKQIKNKSYVQITEKQKKNRFILFCVSAIIGIFGWPFVTPEQPGVSLQMQLLISLILAPIIIFFMYWIMYKKSAKSITENDT